MRLPNPPTAPLRPSPVQARPRPERIRDPFAAFPRRRLWLLALTLPVRPGPKR